MRNILFITTLLTLISINWLNAEIGPDGTGTVIGYDPIEAVDKEFEIKPGVNLSGINFSRANLEGANLEGADLSDVYFGNANLKGSNLKNANLKDAQFTGADLSGADLSGAELPQYFSRTKLISANLSDSKIETGAYFTEADLSQSNLHGVDFTSADFSGAILIGVDLSNSNLSNANFGSIETGFNPETGNLIMSPAANLKDANLKNAILTDAKLTGSNLAGVNLEGAILNNVKRDSLDLFNLNKINIIQSQIEEGGIGGGISPEQAAAITSNTEGVKEVKNAIFIGGSSIIPALLNNDQEQRNLITANTTKIEELDGILKTADETLEAYSESIDTLNKNDQILNDNDASIMAEINAMKAQLQTLVASVAEKDAQIAEKDAKIAELEQGGGGQSLEQVLEQVRDARAGSVVLTVDPEGDTVTLGLTIEQSDNLIEWTKLEGEITRTIPIPDGKNFYRFALDKSAQREIDDPIVIDPPIDPIDPVIVIDPPIDPPLEF